MKSLLIAVSLVAALGSAAHAEVVSQMLNKAGGKIQLTDVPCANPADGILRAHSYTREGSVLNGCWYVDDGDGVNVTWYFNGSKRMSIYPINDFVLTPAGVAYNRRNRESTAPTYY